jgi:hypothetical protein
MFVYDAYSLVLDQFIGRSWTNTVVLRGGFLVAGNELGNVGLVTLPAIISAGGDIRSETVDWSYRRGHQN